LQLAGRKTVVFMPGLGRLGAQTGNPAASICSLSSRARSAGISGRTETLQWLFWQMSGLGPMAGQNHHFCQYAPEQIPYAIDRYVKETNRLYGVLNKRLADREFVTGPTYSIADMAMYPWIVPHQRQRQNLDDFPHIRRWFAAVAERPATQRAYDIAARINTQPTVTEEAKAILFGQTSATADGASC
jgi:GST-like protein